MVRGSKMETLQVERLESQLQRSLRPVMPDPAFVGHLQHRLKSPAEFVIERRENLALSMLLLAISLMVGFILIWLLRQRTEEADQNTEGKNTAGEAPSGESEFAL